MENYLWIGFIGAVLALLFAAIQRKKVMSYSEGNATMQKIAQSIREGANAYLKHQYSTVAKVFAVVFVVLSFTNVWLNDAFACVSGNTLKLKL